MVRVLVVEVSFWVRKFKLGLGGFEVLGLRVGLMGRGIAV